MKGTGVLMNDEMDDFAAKPGTPNMFGLIQGERNAVAPRKAVEALELGKHRRHELLQPFST